MTRRHDARNALLAAGGAAAALAAYAFLVEPRWLETTHTRIHRRGLHADLEGFRIALLTDLHAGEGVPLSLIRRACRMAMREKPDLIALTGDFAADSSVGFDRVLSALDELSAPFGVYAVPGNHDHTVGIETWHRQVARHPVLHDLTNGATILRVGDARLCVAGVDDYSEGEPTLSALPAPKKRDFTLLLAHDPGQAERARRGHDRVDLIVSGHTHGGQVRMPFVGALRNPSEHDELYDEGLRRRPWTQVYTSRGVGTVHIPVRFLCRPEVAILELTGTPRPPR
ncbi:MAG TPA: metallophosphoesterase [Longimicrobiaceae bacterium]|jgi:predicted MPP superfamily phosphohydrolase|nr:metallophosphoesterase [Longimicrobiaceae bacterium]